jgi:hypothetical protein
MCNSVKPGFAAQKVMATEFIRVDVGLRWAWAASKDSAADTPLVVVGM